MRSGINRHRVREKELLADMNKRIELIKAGYAGVMKNGNIVDRREQPMATPIPKNSMFCTPAPKPVTVFWIGFEMMARLVALEMGFHGPKQPTILRDPRQLCGIKGAVKLYVLPHDKGEMFMEEITARLRVRSESFNIEVIETKGVEERA